MALEPYNVPAPTSGFGLPTYVNPITPNTGTLLKGITPTYVSPIRPTIQPVVTLPAARVSIPPKINIFDNISNGVTSIANAVRTGANAIGDATRTYAEVKTTVKTQAVDPIRVEISSDTRGQQAAPVTNDVNKTGQPTNTIQGLPSNNYLILGAIALVIIVLLMRK